MAFRSVNEAHKFYLRYAYEVGFPLKRYRGAKSHKCLNCSMEGKCAERTVDNPKVRKTSSKRMGCKAGMKLKFIYDDAGKNVVSVRIDILRLKHNHAFITDKAENDPFSCIKSHDPAYREFRGAMQDSRVPQHCIMDLVMDMHGGPEFLLVTSQDGCSEGRENNSNDMTKLLEFFTECKKQNPQFFCDFQLEDDGKIRSIFWSHTSQQDEYADFGDAVTFDTTHKTNLYGKPLGMFVGANNHLRCTTFGFVLLGDETIETFEWAFNAFKIHVLCIYADQNPAMPVALGRVFPNTIHRLCLWHVQNRFRTHLNELYKRFEDTDLKAKFQSIIHHPLTPFEFEATWEWMLDEFSLRDDTTLKSLHEIQNEWIPAFFKDDFCTVMVSTQRSESMNKVVKNSHVDVNTPLHEFAKQMMKMMYERKMKEVAEALACKGQRETNTLYPFEIRVARTYTRVVMCRFEESMKYSTAYKIVSDPDGGPDDYLVRHTNRSNKIVWGQHEFKVKTDVDAGKYCCECKQWEHTGLLCVHLIKAFTHLQIERIPKEYVMKRYTTNAKVDVLFHRYDRKMQGKDGKTALGRQNVEMLKTMKVVTLSGMSEARKNMALVVLDKLIEDMEMMVHQLRKGEVKTADAGETVINGSSFQGIQPHDAIEARKAISLEKPDRAKPKGRTIKENEASSMKLGAKGEKKKNIKCKKCGVADGHNSRTCLTLKENRVRLANMVGRKKGRLLGSRNKSAISAAHWIETSTSRKRSVEFSDDEDTDDSDMETDGSAQGVDEMQLSTRVLRSKNNCGTKFIHMDVYQTVGNVSNTGVQDIDV
ncbi:hypothetical protein U9M48_008934 [Paspalum notatum var. saurae]|uniref:Protein FAR1-RELATED SEQUENCE n=1 Tax=Paspalum notatum var. saurae TaxID=547442 RepID=A0AAQ3WE85_PASNO